MAAGATIKVVLDAVMGLSVSHTAQVNFPAVIKLGTQMRCYMIAGQLNLTETKPNPRSSVSECLAQM